MKERLRILMQIYSINQTELAQKIGVSKMTISHIMSDNGRGGGFKQETIEAFKRSFPTLDINWLINGTGTAPLPIDETSLFGQPTVEPDLLTKDPESSMNDTEKVHYTANQPSAEYSSDLGITGIKEDNVNIRTPKEIIPSRLNTEANVFQNPGPKVVEKQITRIVMFYSDGTFKDYKPE